MRGRTWLLSLVLLACGSDPEPTLREDAGSPRADASRPDAAADAAVREEDAAIADAASDRDATIRDAADEDAAVEDASSQDAATASASSLLQVCRAYVDALCDRWLRCGVIVDRTDGCTQRWLACPDLLFAPGSMHQPEEVAACTRDELPAYACHPLFVRKLPACARAGARAVGQPCRYDAQCATADCSGRNAACGVCQARAPRGASCSGQMRCEEGLYCSASGTCADFPSIGDRDFLSRLGEPCEFRCEDGARCVGDASSPLGKRCVAGVPNGDCDWTSECPLGHACVCDDGDGPEGCAGVGPGVCTALPSAGQPCQDLLDSTESCDRASVCDSSQMPARCVARVPVGQACSYTIDGVCAEGSQCSGPTGICQTIRLEGERCGGATEVCEPLTRCEQGTCVADPVGPDECPL